MTGLLPVLVLALLAAGMSTVAAIAVKWSVFANGPLAASVVQFVLAMMAAMFVGVVVYFAVGGAAGIASGLWVASGVMSVSVVVVAVGFLRELRLRTGGTLRGPAHARDEAFALSVIALVLANEFLMGWSFSLLTHALPVGLGPGGRGTLAIATGAVVSPWFVFPMALEMVLTLSFLVSWFPPAMRRLLALQPAIMICSPPTLAGRTWLVASTVGASALMALAVAWLLLALVRDEPISPATGRYLLGLFASLAAMAAGLYIWVELSSAGLFALSLVAQMVAFLWAATGPRRFGSAVPEGGARNWTLGQGPPAEPS